MPNNRTLKPEYGPTLVSLFLILSLALTSVSSSIAAPPPPADMAFETIDLPLAAQAAPHDLIANVRTPDNPKLDSTMASLAAAARVSTQQAIDLARSQSLRLSGNRVHVQVVTHAPGLGNAIEAINEAGGEVTGVGNDDTLIQGWLPLDALETVAARDDVYRIRRPAEVQLVETLHVGNSTTEGLAVMNGPAWHTAGCTGSGVKVGVIDGGFEGYTGLLGTDLPASVTVKNFVDGEDDSQVDGTSVHGTACAEVIHDIVPDATLYLAKINTNLDLQEAVAWLKDTHQVDVISTSLGWYNLTPGDGTGEFADLVQDARDDGILWATAASNDREAHWGGLYSDPDTDDAHNFDGDQEINYFGPGDGSAYAIPAGYTIMAFLRWDDWTNVDQDYNMHLLRWNGSSWDIVASGDDVQDGSPGQTPTEFAYAVTSGADTAYGFVIERDSSTRTVNFEVFLPKVAPLDEVLHARSLSNLADAPGAMTVAALDVTSPYPQESYSSEGPTNGPGGTETGGFTKPDISGFANVATESYTGSSFNGTSAATPHVAGAAALVLSANPSYTPDQLQSFLEGRAIDMGTTGMDTLYGYGRLHLGGPLNTAPTIADLPDQTVPMNGSADNAIDLWDFAEDAEDADADLIFTIVNSPIISAGVTVDANRYVDINPATDWTGVTDVQVQVQDTGGLTDTDVFQVVVTNTAPIVSGLPDQEVPMNGSADNAIDLWDFAEDAEDADADLTFTIDNTPDPGAGVGMDSNRYIDINPAIDWTGQTDVVIRVTDSGGLYDTDTFSVTVTETNTLPTISGLPDQEVPMNGSVDNAIDLWDFAEDTEDADADLTFAIVNSPIVSAGVTVDANRYIDINPAADWTGVTDVRVQVQDTGGLTDTDVFQVIVTNTVPIISGLPDQTVPMNGSADNAIDLWNFAEDAEDADADLTFTIDNTPDPGAGVSMDSNRYIDINPATDWTGQTDVVVRVTDSGGLYDTDAFSVTVLPAAAKTWNGDLSSDWHTADNWTPSGVPTSGDDVTIPDVTHDPVVSSGDAAVNNLTVNPGAVLDLTGHTLMVEGVLTNNGTLKQTQGVWGGSTSEFLRITNLAGTETKYYGVDIAPSGASNAIAAPTATLEAPRIHLAIGELDPLENVTLTLNAPQVKATPTSYDEMLRSGLRQAYGDGIDADGNAITLNGEVGRTTVVPRTLPESTTTILMDYSHGVLFGKDPTTNYTNLTALLEAQGHTVVASNEGILNLALDDYGVIVLDSMWSATSSYSTDEVNALQDFTDMGGGLLLVGEASGCTGCPEANSNLNQVATALAGITLGVSTIGPTDLYFANFQPHEIFGGVSQLYYRYAGGLGVVPPGVELAYTDSSLDVTVAGYEKIIAVGDDSFMSDGGYWGNADDQLFLENIFSWLSRTGISNTPPTISGLPDQAIPVNGSADNAIDLWAYASDAEDTSSAMTYTIANSPDLDAGVSLDSNRYIDINPTTDWTGVTDVQVQVQDTGGMTDTDAFRVTVNGAPDIEVSPASFEETLAVDEVLTATLTISNAGGASLMFLIGDGGASWLSENPDSGTVALGGSQLLDVVFDATGQSVGDYTTDLNIVNNDPDENPVTVPVTMHVSSANTAPTISGLPDQQVPMNGSADDAIDLWTYADDAEDADADLTFSIVNSPDVNAGVTLDASQYIDINPATDWSGVTDVEVQVQDTGGLTDTDIFQVTITHTGVITNVTVSVSGNQFCAGRTSGVERCFDITPAAALEATVRFYFSEAERNGLTLDDLLVFHYDGDWTEEPGPYTSGGTGDAQYVEAQNIDDFSLFALGKSEPATVYLPLVIKCWLLFPYTPVLNPISNADGDGNYTVSWNAALLANTYTLREGDNVSFASPATAYGPDTATSTAISSKQIGTYY